MYLLEKREAVGIRHRRIVNVYSDKSERRLTSMTVVTLEDSLHEAHVVKEEGKVAFLPRAAIPAPDRSVDEGDATGAPKIVN